MGLIEAGDAELKGSAELGLKEVLRTVDTLDKMGAFDKMAEIRAAREQTFLDLVGDSAHALRGLQLATGEAKMLY